MNSNANIFSFNADPAWLDAQHNNRLLVPEFMTHFENWRRDSVAARVLQPCELDIAYGKSTAEKLDIFPARAASKARKNSNAPVLVFIHGGYWRSLDKFDHSFVAPAFTKEACVVIPNYPLCPSVTMEQLVLSQVHALIWVYRNIAKFGGDPSRITVIGHSAGGHLAAMLLTCQWQKVSRDLPSDLVKNALTLSGLHDLEPLRHSPYIAGDLKLTKPQISRCSPAYFPAPRGKLVALCGADESSEFRRHNRLIQQSWGKLCVSICEEVPGANHFSVLEALCSAGQRAHDLAISLLRK